MPYKDPEKQRQAVRAASARWYQTRKSDQEFLDHRAETARKHSAKITQNERVRRAQEREADVYAALARLKTSISGNQTTENQNDEEEHLSADDA